MPREESHHQDRRRATSGSDESHAQRLYAAIRKVIPSNMGFAVFVFRQTKDGRVENASEVSYIASANREDMVGTIRTWLSKVTA